MLLLFFLFHFSLFLESFRLYENQAENQATAINNFLCMILPEKMEMEYEIKNEWVINSDSEFVFSVPVP